MDSGEDATGDDHKTVRSGSQKDKFRHRNSGKGSTWTSSVHVPASDIPINNKSRTLGRLPSNNLLPGQTADPDIPFVPDATSPTGSDFLHASKRLVREKNDGMEEDDYEDDEEEEEEEERHGDQEEQATKMSLMSLLAENDEELGSGGLAYMMENHEEEEEEEEGGGGEYRNCCVCMVKHKGTAFEPCGHSFCRLCSREMWVEKGNCPLCNNYVLEILDIF